MKRLGAYNPSLYIYNNVSPTITINDNYDKYIVSGNTKKRNIYLIFAGNINQIREVYRILNNDEIKDIIRDMNNIYKDKEDIKMVKIS